MKTLLINGSPRKNGNTHLALTEVARTLKAEGIETEIFWLGNKPVRGCTACYACVSKNLGKCIFDDDVCNRLSAHFAEADAFVIGAPTYFGQPAGALLAVVQRAFFSARAHVEGKPAASVAICRRGGSTAAFHDYDEVKKTATLLTEARHKRSLLREPTTEDEIIAALGDAAGLWEFMFPGARQELIQLVVGEIVVFPERISFVLKVDGLKDLASEMAIGGYFNQPHGNPAEIPESRQDILDDGSIRITMKLELKRIEGHRRVVIPAPGAERLKQTSLLRAINNARKWMDMLINGEAQNVTDLSKQLGLKTGYVTRILSLNSLAPDIVEAILAGIEPDGLSIAKLTEQPIPEDWNEQRRLYGFPER